jgi:hypothetical protein
MESKHSNKLTVKTALEIFENCKLDKNHKALLEMFSNFTGIERISINEPALISKLYRYKQKLKGKRVKAKEQFENETFSIPVATISTQNQSQFHENEITCLQETCSSLAKELSDWKNEYEEKEESVNLSMKITENHKQEVSTLKRKHNEEMKSETKHLKNG